jgi:hypothetical protein
VKDEEDLKAAVHDIHAEDISFNWRLGVNVKCS